MAKRFIDTGFLDQKWIRKLSPERKIFLIYLMLKCDNGGIIELDFDDASFWIGNKIEALDFLPNGYLILLNDSDKYFMPKFIEWQYPNFPHSKVHQQEQAKRILIQNGLFDIDNQCIILPNNYPNITQNLRKSYVTVNGNANVNGNGNEEKGCGGKQSTDFINEIISAFKISYENFNQIPYEIINKGKERSAAGKLLQIYKNRFPDYNTDKMIESMQVYFDACVSINDDWLRKRMTLPILLSEFNKINNILKHGRNKTGGATDAELAAITAKHFPVTN